MSVEGTKIELQRDESRLYWTPAPPKLDVPPSKVRDVLFPEYQPATLGVETQEGTYSRQEDVESSEESEEEEVMTDVTQDRYDEIFRYIYILRSYHIWHSVFVLSVVKFNLRYSYWSLRDWDFIFGRHIYSTKEALQMIQRFITLWHWLWPLC